MHGRDGWLMTANVGAQAAARQGRRACSELLCLILLKPTVDSKRLPTDADQDLESSLHSLPKTCLGQAVR